eukprot:6208718-Prymnesium_polylepis.1
MYTYTVCTVAHIHYEYREVGRDDAAMTQEEATAAERSAGRGVSTTPSPHERARERSSADALAAIRRATAVGATPVTAELMDRIQRAVDGMQEYPDITCHGGGTCPPHSTRTDRHGWE